MCPGLEQTARVYCLQAWQAVRGQRLWLEEPDPRCYFGFEGLARGHSLWLDWLARARCLWPERAARVHSLWTEKADHGMYLCFDWLARARCLWPERPDRGMYLWLVFPGCQSHRELVWPDC